MPPDVIDDVGSEYWASSRTVPSSCEEVGVVPCPTLAVIAGFTLGAGGFGWRTVPAALAVWSALYGLFGVFGLGVVLDSGLLVAAAGLIALTIQKRARGVTSLRIGVLRPSTSVGLGRGLTAPPHQERTFAAAQKSRELAEDVRSLRARLRRTELADRTANSLRGAASGAIVPANRETWVTRATSRACQASRDGRAAIPQLGDNPGGGAR